MSLSLNSKKTVGCVLSFLLVSHVCICHGRKSNLVEFQILLVKSPIGFLQAKSLIRISTKINLVDSPVGVSYIDNGQVCVCVCVYLFYTKRNISIYYRTQSAI